MGQSSRRHYLPLGGKRKKPVPTKKSGSKIGKVDDPTKSKSNRRPRQKGSGSKEKQVAQLLNETNDSLPLKDEEKIELGRKSTGLVPLSKRGNKGLHPLGVGLKHAKVKIAQILEKAENIEMLGISLQMEFEKSPTLFLRTYAPLLKRYEEMGTDRSGSGPSPVSINTGVIIRTEREQIRVQALPMENAPIEVELAEEEPEDD